MGFLAAEGEVSRICDRQPAPDIGGGDTNCEGSRAEASASGKDSRWLGRGEVRHGSAYCLFR